jgi:formylglycine-generating enzyme required for sulfatase activity
MAYFAGAERCFIGSDELPTALRHERSIPAFYLDPAEVTLEDYQRGLAAPIPSFPHYWPHELKQDPPPPSHAVTLVSYDEAVDFAERIGKRLPDEFEFEFAAARGGHTRFPWGDDASLISDTQWEVGPVRGNELDRTDTTPPVYGLFSNALEWTTSWNTLYPADRQLLSSPELADSRLRIVRGGPAWRAKPGGEPGTERFGASERIPVEWAAPTRGIGFRCARSARPRIRPTDFGRPHE